jgi:hypothetical protein
VRGNADVPVAFDGGDACHGDLSLVTLLIHLPAIV